MADFVDVRGRALLKTGTWSASTGEEVITLDDLHAIVAASHSGVLDNAVIKLGHTDPERNRFSDGEPAYGRVANLRVVDGTLYGDYLSVPRELAESLSSAYPHVSVELARHVKLRTAEGTVAHAFDCVLTAAALLGATPPAVKGLSQRAYAFSEDQMDYTTFIDFSEVFPDPDVELAAKKRTTAKAQPAEEPAAKPAEGEVDNTLTDLQPPATPEPITETADTTDDTGEVPPRRAEIADSSPEAPAPTPAPAPPAKRAAPNGVRTMPNVDDQAARLRKKYGLPDSATYKDVLEKLLEDDIVAGVQQNDKLDTRAGSDESPSHDEVLDAIADETERRQKYNLSEGETPAEQVNVTAPVRAVELDDVFVSRSAFAELMSDYEATKAKLAAREATETKLRRDQMVVSWFHAGLIGKDERAGVRADLDEAEDVVIRNVQRRTPMPVEEMGHSRNDVAHFALDTDDTKTEALYAADDALFGA